MSECSRARLEMAWPTARPSSIFSFLPASTEVSGPVASSRRTLLRRSACRVSSAGERVDYQRVRVSFREFVEEVLKKV